MLHRWKETTKTVLLVEDDDHVRCLTSIIFHRAGWKVISAATAKEAYARRYDHYGPIALLVTDVHLPDTKGTDLSRTLAEFQPQMKVLFLTGDDVQELVAANPEGIFLQKPFSVSDLQTLMDVLSHENTAHPNHVITPSLP
jgi:FixJ family two-component response regulator